MITPLNAPWIMRFCRLAGYNGHYLLLRVSSRYCSLFSIQGFSPTHVHTTTHHWILERSLRSFLELFGPAALSFRLLCLFKFWLYLFSAGKPLISPCVPPPSTTAWKLSLGSKLGQLEGLANVAAPSFVAWISWILDIEDNSQTSEITLDSCCFIRFVRIYNYFTWKGVAGPVTLSWPWCLKKPS